MSKSFSLSTLLYYIRGGLSKKICINSNIYSEVSALKLWLVNIKVQHAFGWKLLAEFFLVIYLKNKGSQNQVMDVRAGITEALAEGDSIPETILVDLILGLDPGLPPETRTCYNCNKVGHVAKDCRLPRRQQQMYRPRQMNAQGLNTEQNTQPEQTHALCGVLRTGHQRIVQLS